MASRSQNKPGIWLLLLALAVTLFFWKILFTNQFSPLTGYDNADQFYAWYNFAAASLQQGILPLWDPYTHSGRSFVGEMLPGLFYPLKLLVYLWPFNRSHVLSPQLLHVFFVLAHVLGAWFMFLLAGDLGLPRFPALLAGLCFSLGGFVGQVGWLCMLDSAIWLPLIVFFLRRALVAERASHWVLYACAAGLSFGMAILAGSLHLAMMDVLVVGGAVVYFSSRSSRQLPGRALDWRGPWARGAMVLGVTGLVAFLAGAVQLLPSMEYSPLALRYMGGAVSPIAAAKKIPYADMNDGLLPRSLWGFVFGLPFPGLSMGAEECGPYFGVLPLLLSIVGVWRNWSHPWVRFLAGTAVLSFFYTMGSYSLLHGLAYSLVPFLWMAREAGRFIYITHFATALLAGFGAQALFAGEGDFSGLARTLKWVALVAGIPLSVPAFFGKPEINEWEYFSFLLLLGACGLVIYITRGHRTGATRFLVVALTLIDLHGFHWTFRDQREESRLGRNHLQALLDSRDLADFFRSEPGLFRVHFIADLAPNIGDVYRIQTTWGMSATTLRDYGEFYRVVPRADDLLNVRFIVRPGAAPGDGRPVYQDPAWKVYENPSACPRAWVVYRVVVEPSREKLLKRVAEPGFDPLRVAAVREPILLGVEDSPAQAHVDRYRAGHLELSVRSKNRGLLVLSEVDYPGWQASVNGEPARIYNVNGLLRGVVVPGGASKVVFRYAPRSVLAGAILTGLAFLGTLAGAIALKVRSHSIAKL